MVNLMLAAAQRDPSAFTEPDLFDPGREANSHSSWSASFHSGTTLIEGRGCECQGQRFRYGGSGGA